VEQRELGRSGVGVSRPILGCGNFGGVGSAPPQLLDLAEPPTAIFAANDNMAFGMLRAARERGIPVPDRLSGVGFDDARSRRS